MKGDSIYGVSEAFAKSLETAEQFLYVQYIDFSSSKSILNFFDVAKSVTPHYEYIKGKAIIKGKESRFKNKTMEVLQKRLLKEGFNEVEFRFQLTDPPIGIEENVHWIILSGDHPLWSTVYGSGNEACKTYLKYRERERVVKQFRDYRPNSYPNILESVYKMPLTDSAGKKKILDFVSEVYREVLPQLISHPDFYIYVDIIEGMFIGHEGVGWLASYENGMQELTKRVVDKTPIVIGPKEKLIEVPTDVDATITDIYTVQDVQFGLLRQYKGRRLSQGLEPIKNYRPEKGTYIINCSKGRRSSYCKYYTSERISELLKEEIYYPEELMTRPIICEKLWDKMKCDDSKKLYDLIQDYQILYYEKYYALVEEIYINMSIENEKRRVIEAHIEANIQSKGPYYDADNTRDFLYKYYKIQDYNS